MSFEALFIAGSSETAGAMNRSNNYNAGRVPNANNNNVIASLEWNVYNISWGRTGIFAT